MNQPSFELGDIAPAKYFAGVAVLLAFLFSLVANNEDAPYLTNLLQWLFQSIVPMTLMVLSFKLVLSATIFNQLNPWLRLFFAGCAGALLFVPLALLLDLWLGHDPVPTSGMAVLCALVDEAAGVMPPVVLCWLAINAPWVLGFKVVKTQQPTEVQAELPQEQSDITSNAKRLLDLLPATKRGGYSVSEVRVALFDGGDHGGPEFNSVQLKRCHSDLQQPRWISTTPVLLGKKVSYTRIS